MLLGGRRQVVNDAEAIEHISMRETVTNEDKQALPEEGMGFGAVRQALRPTLICPRGKHTVGQSPV